MGEIFGIFDMLKKILKGLFGVVYWGKFGYGYEKLNSKFKYIISFIIFECILL